MKKIYTWIVEHRKWIMAVFLILVCICAISSKFISVNYDMNDYLPESSASTQALNIMEDEFEGGIPNARVMVSDLSVSEALQMKEKLENVDGVTDVTWLDDVEEITCPTETMDSGNLDTYYKNNNALYSVTISDDKNLEAVNQIRKIIGKDNAMSGSAVSTAVAAQSTVKEIQKIAIFAVLFVLVVLIFTTESWVEPIIILIGLGVAVVINAGSNLIFGEISFVTNAAGNILQIAVSLDYAIFLLHRFEECRLTESDPKKAMVHALQMSGSSILSSGMTTVIGFLALCLMKFQIGPDLGRALAKGIAISLLTVFLFMPGLILICEKWINKTRHRSFLPKFRKLGKNIYKIRIVVVIAFLIVIVPSFLASGKNDFYYGASHIFNSQTQVGQDKDKIEAVYGKSDTYVLLLPKGDTDKQLELSQELKKLPQVDSILSYVDSVGAQIPESYVDADILKKLNSDHYTRMVLSVKAEYEGDETFQLVEEIRTIAQKEYPDQWYLAGEGVSTKDLRDTVTSDMVKVNFIAIGAVFLILVLTMRSVFLPVILVLCIETAIWINLSVPYFGSKPLFYIAYLIISSIQLGATVDYAILMTERYREMRQTYDRKHAVEHTISAVMASILTSGSVMTVVGFLLGYVSTHGLLAQLGILLGRGSLLSMFLVIFVLPGLLVICDRFVVKNRNRIERKQVSNESK